MSSDEKNLVHVERDGDDKFSKKWIESHWDEIIENSKYKYYKSSRDILLNVIKEDNLDLDVDVLLNNL